MTAADGDSAHALVDAARTLFARHGIAHVSLRQVGREANQRNTNAVQYHFGTRDALLAAVVQAHHATVGVARDAMLDRFDAEREAGEDAGPDVGLRALAGALVRPSATMLETEAGREYLRIAGELVTDPANLRRGGVLASRDLGRWDVTARRHMDTITLPLHRRFSAIHLSFTELGRRAGAARRRDHRLFVSDLVDLTTSVLGAPVSDETRALLAERDDR